MKFEIKTDYYEEFEKLKKDDPTIPEKRELFGLILKQRALYKTLRLYLLTTNYDYDGFPDTSFPGTVIVESYPDLTNFEICINTCFISKIPRAYGKERKNIPTWSEVIRPLLHQIEEIIWNKFDGKKIDGGSNTIKICEGISKEISKLFLPEIKPAKYDFSIWKYFPSSSCSCDSSGGVG